MLIGILSDTHLDNHNENFSRQCRTIFSDCDAIIHAGDLTDLAVLEPFRGKKIYAVSGNMCNRLAQQTLPKERIEQLEQCRIGISHGEGPRHNIEDRLFTTFAGVDCIVYGHTHIACCHYYGKTLMINPGSFKGTGPYGDPGTYALLEIAGGKLSASIHSL